MTTSLVDVNNPAVPNLPLAPFEYESRYQEQFNNVLRLYFNQLNAGISVLVDNQNVVQAQIARDLALVWVGSGEGMFSG